MDINFNKSTNITWKPDNTLEVASSNGHVSKITGVSFANYLLVKDNPKLLKLIEKRNVFNHFSPKRELVKLYSIYLFVVGMFYVQ